MLLAPVHVSIRSQMHYDICTACSHQHSRGIGDIDIATGCEASIGEERSQSVADLAPGSRDQNLGMSCHVSAGLFRSRSDKRGSAISHGIARAGSFHATPCSSLGS